MCVAAERPLQVVAIANERLVRATVNGESRCSYTTVNRIQMLDYSCSHYKSVDTNGNRMWVRRIRQNERGKLVLKMRSRIPLWPRILSDKTDVAYAYRPIHIDEGGVPSWLVCQGRWRPWDVVSVYYLFSVWLPKSWHLYCHYVY